MIFWQIEALRAESMLRAYLRPNEDQVVCTGQGNLIVLLVTNSAHIHHRTCQAVFEHYVITVLSSCFGNGDCLFGGARRSCTLSNYQ